MLDKPTRKRGDTREKLLALAEAAVLAKGFAATSIDELIAAAGITKSGFFYHFKDKGELAKALLERYLEVDAALLDDLFARADELNEDPLHGLLIALKLFAEAAANLEEAHPGCLAASFTYQDQLFRPEIRDLNARGLLAWRARFRERFEVIAMTHTPRVPIDIDALADTVTTVVEGGIMLSRALRDPTILPRQIMLLRDFIRLTFTPQAMRRAA